MGNVLRRAVMKNMVSNKRETEPTDVVVAILVEDDGYAAQLLREQGLTVAEAENEALSGFSARQIEQARRIEEMQARIAKESARQSHSSALSSVAIGEASGASVVPRLYLLRVASEDSASETRFKAAVSCDGRLELYIESTPFEIEFGALRVAALFESVDDDGRLRVELLTEINGQRRPVLGFGGRSGVIFEDPTDAAGRRSGSL